MRLQALTLFHLRVPLRRPFVTSRGRQEAREVILLRLDTSLGDAWGECSAGSIPGYTSETLADAWDWYRAQSARWLGRPLPSPQDFTACEAAALQKRPMAVAGFEMALWDAWGREKGLPLYRLLGGAHVRVPVGVALGLREDPKALCTEAEALIRRGYRRLKIKIKPGQDRRPLAVLRDCLPPGFPLMADANGAYRRDQTDWLQGLDEFSLQMLEQPFPAEDWEAHRALQARMATPLCLDEGFRTPAQAQRALAMGVCRALNVKPARVGGLNVALDIVRATDSLEGDLWVGGMLETGIGRAASLALASLPAFTRLPDLSASERYYPRDVITDPFVLNPDGTINLPPDPGLGVRVDEGALRAFTLRQLHLS